MNGLIKGGTMMNRIRPAVSIVVLGLMAVAPASSHARQPAGGGWIGKRVVQKYSSFQLKIENQVIDPKDWIATYRVEQVNRPWLWLHAGELNGWAPADQVVPVEQAIAFFADYIRSNPGDSFGYTMRAMIWTEEKKELDIALGDYNEAIRLNPTKVAVYGNRGNGWYAKKEYDKAIADYNEAIRLDPTEAALYNNRGNAWYAKKEYDKAIADYNEAIRLDPKYTRVYNSRAWLWATCPDAKYRDGKNAVESATNACELSAWKVPYMIGTLSAAHAEAGDFESAVKWQSKAIELLTDEKEKEDYRSRLKLYQEKRPYRDTQP
ncbi:MAG: tetratricopeptide repeat protein [Isosphaerales bacterium]